MNWAVSFARDVWIGAYTVKRSKPGDVQHEQESVDEDAHGVLPLLLRRGKRLPHPTRAGDNLLAGLCESNLDVLVVLYSVSNSSPTQGTPLTLATSYMLVNIKAPAGVLAS